MQEIYLKNSLGQLKMQKTQSFQKEEKLSQISMSSITDKSKTKFDIDINKNKLYLEKMKEFSARIEKIQLSQLHASFDQSNKKISDLRNTTQFDFERVELVRNEDSLIKKYGFLILLIVIVVIFLGLFIDRILED